MNDRFTAATGVVPRDQWGRPKVIPPQGGKPVAYTRCTTFVDVLEDKFNLQRWMQRMVALGLSERPDLMLSVTAHPDDKKQLDSICEDAVEAAKAKAAATVGTAVHALTERMDRGHEVGTVPADYVADLAAYQTATESLKVEHIERFCVLDWLKVGGTPDRIVKHEGKRYIADLKTGQIQYGIGKIAMQLAIYARSQMYDPADGERTNHGTEFDKGLIIHLPAGTGECRLWWIDLLAGWEGVKLAKSVREWRTRKFDALTESFHMEHSEAPLPERIEAAETVDQLLELWSQNQQTWTDEYTELAAARKAQLQEGHAA